MTACPAFGHRPRAPHHRRVEDRGELMLIQARHEAFRPHAVPEQDPAHLDQIGRPFRRVTLPHERLVAQGHMGEQHIQVPLVHGDIGRLADRAADMVQPFRLMSRASRSCGNPPSWHSGGRFPCRARRADHRPAPARTCRRSRRLRSGIAGMLDIVPRRRGAEPTRQALGQVHPVPGRRRRVASRARNASQDSRRTGRPISSRTRSALASISASPSSSGIS